MGKKRQVEQDAGTDIRAWKLQHARAVNAAYVVAALAREFDRLAGERSRNAVAMPATKLSARKKKSAPKKATAKKARPKQPAQDAEHRKLQLLHERLLVQAEKLQQALSGQRGLKA